MDQIENQLVDETVSEIPTDQEQSEAMQRIRLAMAGTIDDKVVAEPPPYPLTTVNMDNETMNRVDAAHTATVNVVNKQPQHL